MSQATILDCTGVKLDTPPAVLVAPNGYFEARIYKCGGHQALSHWEGSKKMTMVAGIDVGKANLDVSVSGGPVLRFDNTATGIHGLPSGPLAEAVVQQPAGTAEPGDKAPQSLPPKGDVVGIFPNRLSARRLVGAVLAEQHDEWAEARRYLTIPNAAGNEALPTPNMLDAAA